MGEMEDEGWRMSRGVIGKVGGGMGGKNRVDQEV
jgi:hypothetical protein